MTRGRPRKGILARAALEGGWDGFIRPRAHDGQRLAADLLPLHVPVAVGAVLVCLLLFQTPFGWVDPGEAFDVGVVTLVDAGFLFWAWGLAFALVGTVVFLAALTITWGEPWRGRALIAAGWACVLLAGPGWISQASPWTVEARAVSPEGDAHAVLVKRWVESTAGYAPRDRELWVLAEVMQEGWVTTSYGSLFVRDPDEPGGFSFLVRPTRMVGPEPWRIVFPAPKVVAGISDENRAYLFHAAFPFDWVATARPDLSSFEEANAVAVGELSPFLLLGPDDEAHGRDLQALVQFLLHASPGDAGYPPRSLVASEFDNPNRFAALAARQILELVRDPPGAETAAPEPEPELESWTSVAPELPPTPSPTPEPGEGAAEAPEGPPATPPPGPDPGRFDEGGRWVPPGAG